MRRASFSFLFTSIGRLTAAFMSFAALSATQAQASASDPTPSENVRRALTIGEVLVRSDGKSLYLSEDGLAFEELALDGTVEALRLKELSARLNLGPQAVSIPLNRLIVADGGAGVHVSKRTESSHDSTDAQKTE
jgi:hypothetical protein